MGATEDHSTDEAPPQQGADQADPGQGQGPDPTGPDTGKPGRPLIAFLPRLALWAVLLAFVELADPNPALSLMLVALAGIVTIISDDRFAFERRLEDAGIPSREAWVPLAMLLILAQLDLIDPDRIGNVIGEDGPVIAFILAFAVVAEGLRRSGFIHFLAYRLTDRGGANTTRLMLYLFLLSSLLAYFTSNDIVILTMTPIVVSVAYQARVDNAKLLLLSQFVAANTVSMGLLIGSPSNLIVGRALNLRFFEYMFLMVVPALMALMGTFVLVTIINRFVERRAETGGRLVRSLVGTWTFSPRYRPPRFSEFRSFTPEMRRWVAVFGLSVGLLAVGTSSGTGLLLATITIATIGIGSLYRSSREHDEPNGRTFAGKTLRTLPVGIVFFGLTYFVIADAIADTPFVRGDVDEFVSEQASRHTPVASWGSTLTAGALVNTMNDLPAGALSGKVLERAEFRTPFDQALVTQSTLVGLNIATYVTPVGALAGIIWFDILRKERRRRYRAAQASGIAEPFDVVMPQRRDLIVYGTATFLSMTAILGATNFGFVALADMLLGPPDGGSVFGSGPDHLAWTLGCLTVAVVVVVAFRRVLARAGVALAHLGDVLVVLTSLRLWASRHRVAAGAAIAGLLFVGTGALLYWAESFHAREYHRPVQFETPGQFVTWLAVFVSSGFENGEFPYSVLGNLLAAVLALGSIAALVLLIRLSTGSNDLNLRRKLGRGEIPTDRLVIVNCAVEHRGLVRTLIAESSRFVTIATRDPRLEGRLGLRGRDRVAVIPVEDSSADLVTQLRLEDASELVLLSRSVTDDFDNLALLSALDAVAGERAHAVPELTGLTGAGRGRLARRRSARAGGDAGAGVGVAGAAAAGAVGSVAAGATGATGATGTTIDEADERRLPAVVLQLHERGLPMLVDHRLGRELLDSLAQPPFEAVARAFLVADLTGRLGDLRRLYAEPVVPSAESLAVDRRIRIRGLDIRLAAEPVIPIADDLPIDVVEAIGALEPSPEPSPEAEAAAEAGPDAALPSAPAVGVQVEMAGWPVWRRFSNWRADEVPRPVTGVVHRVDDADGADGAAAGAPGTVVRHTVHVVGGDGFAQRCALDLVAREVPDVRLLAGADEALLPGITETAGLTVVTCDNELRAAEALTQRPSGSDGSDEPHHEAIVVVEGSEGRGLDSEKLLERLSIARLHEAEAQRRVPPLFVCCRGPERAERLRNFVIDKVIDATWVESSYFAAFAAVYFDLVLEDEELANWPASRQLAVAHRVASRLCHLDIGRPGDPRMAEVAAAPGAAARTAATAASAGTAIGDAVVGIVRFSVDHGDADADAAAPDEAGSEGHDPVVVVDIVPADPDRPPGRRDLVAAVRYL